MTNEKSWARAHVPPPDPDRYGTWITYEMPGWRAQFGIAIPGPTDRGPLELRLSALEDEDGNYAAVEETDGVTTEILRSLPLAEVRAEFGRLGLEWMKTKYDLASVVSRVHTPEEWARFASVFVQISRHTTNPLQYMATETGVSRNTLSARVRRCRDMVLLTRPKGKERVELTAEAHRLLGHGAEQEPNERQE